jgi:DNA helicase-2/ATP-dependent DNA helicase PcrA
LGIAIEDIAKISQQSLRSSRSIFETMQALPSGLSPATSSAVNKILALVKKHGLLAQARNVSEILLAFLEESGYLQWLVKKDRKQDLDLIFQFHSRIKSFEQTHLDARLRPFMEELNLELESGEEGKLNFDLDLGPEMVKIMTVHGAKGLEFRYVFLVNLVDKRFPSIERKDPIEIPDELIRDIKPKGDYHLQEERRLFYVGLTRAKDGLFLFSAQDYDGIQNKRLSRFLLELGYKSETMSVKNGTTIIRTKPKPAKLVLPERFSFTQLIAFDKCPLQYKLAHILRIPIRGKAVFSFGKTMHNTLHDFIKAWTEKKADFKKLVQIYEQQWLDEWYDNLKQKQEYFESGKEALKSFYDEFLKTKPRILYISDQPALEQDFNLKIGEHTLIGKIDRIDDLGQGEAEIIDYKTGSGKEKLRPEDKKQLLIYQMAAQEVLGLKPKKLTYYYLDEGKTISFLGSKEDIEKEKEKIIQEIEEIKKSNFAPTPGWQCQWCDFKDICEFAQK